MPRMSCALTMRGFVDSAQSGAPVDVKPGSKVHNPVDGCSFLMSTNLAPDASCQHSHIDGSHQLSLKAASQHLRTCRSSLCIDSIPLTCSNGSSTSVPSGRISLALACCTPFSIPVLPFPHATSRGAGV